MEAVAKLNNCPIAPRKMRLVVNSVRGKDVLTALSLLKFEKKAGAIYVEKLLRSAIANWEQANEGSSIEEAGLYIKEIFVTHGRMLKRFRPAPQGRAHRIRKRSNHVTLVISSAKLEYNEFEKLAGKVEEIQGKLNEQENN